MNRIAETKIIGYSLMSEDLHQIIEIEAKYFLVKLHQEIYQKIKKLERDGKELSLGNLVIELNREKTEDISPILNRMILTAHEAVEVFDFKALMRELEEAFVRNECLELALMIQKIGNDKTLTTLDIINTVKENVNLFTEGVALDDKYPLRYIAEGIGMKLDSLQEGINPVSSGIKELDEITQGFAPKELIVLGGRPGDGKTYTGLVIADNLVKQGKPVLFFSAEMCIEEFATRLIGKEYFAEHSEVLSSAKLSKLIPMSDLEYERCYSIYRKRMDYPFMVQDKPGSILTIADIKKDLLMTKELYGEVGLVVIDYLQLIAKSEQGQLLTYAIGDLLNGLKLLAYEFNCPFFLLAQLNTRNVGNRSDKKPYLSELSDSAQLEKYANKILLLYRESKYNPDAEPDDLEIIVAKNRSGREGSIKCSFNMETGILKAID
jgi:replicative DNA helicase